MAITKCMPWAVAGFQNPVTGSILAAMIVAKRLCAKQKSFSLNAMDASIAQTHVTPNNTMTKIVGNNDGPNGRNETYKIGSRKQVPRKKAVKEVKQGKHPGAHVVKINKKEYVRDNPDYSKKDNVNRNKR